MGKFRNYNFHSLKILNCPVTSSEIYVISLIPLADAQPEWSNSVRNQNCLMCWVQKRINQTVLVILIPELIEIPETPSRCTLVFYVCYANMGVRQTTATTISAVFITVINCYTIKCIESTGYEIIICKETTSQSILQSKAKQTIQII